MKQILCIYNKLLYNHLYTYFTCMGSAVLTSTENSILDRPQHRPQCSEGGRGHLNPLQTVSHDSRYGNTK